MAETMPESYWDDVSRYCGELLVGKPYERRSLIVISTAVQKASWTAAAEKTAATLEKGVIRLLGGLAGRSTYYVLRLVSPVPGSANNTEYDISFNPDRQVIQSAASSPEWNHPQAEPQTLGGVVSSVRDLLCYAGSRKLMDDEMRALGISAPGPADYDLLLSELQRGVASQAPPG